MLLKSWFSSAIFRSLVNLESPCLHSNAASGLEQFLHRNVLLRDGSKRVVTAGQGQQRKLYLLSMFEGLKSPDQDNVHQCISELRLPAGKRNSEIGATC